MNNKIKSVESQLTLKPASRRNPSMLIILVACGFFFIANLYAFFMVGVFTVASAYQQDGCELVNVTSLREFLAFINCVALLGAFLSAGSYYTAE